MSTNGEATSSADLRASDAAVPEPPVLIRRRGRLGLITLNRPKTLNALSGEMVGVIAGALDAWEHDDAVSCILIHGAGDRGLCAGGDLRADGGDPGAFVRAEYRLNARIADYPKPYVAWMDGITMGGGVGVSAHGSLRIVTERSRVAMPETKIALCPDVGGTHLLARAPGLIGLHLGLTSATMDASDAIAAEFADLLAPSDSFDSFVDALADGDDPWAAASRVSRPPERSGLLDARLWIDECYSADTLPETLDRLQQVGGAAAAAADTIARFSPTATSITFWAIHRAAALDLKECLSMEYQIMMQLALRPDVAEGLHATLVDRSYSPHWVPSSYVDPDIRVVRELIENSPLPALW